MCTVPGETNNHLVDGDISRGYVEATKICGELGREGLEFGVPMLFSGMNRRDMKKLLQLLKVMEGHEVMDVMLREMRRC